MYKLIPELRMYETVDPDFTADHIPGHAYRPHSVLYRSKQDRELYLCPMEWGVIPYYIDDEKGFVRQRASMLNIRSERILDEKRSYWYKIRNNRCLVPMTGFYEYREVEGWKTKVPYYIWLRDQPLFFVPGLYSIVDLPDAQGALQKRWTFALITRPANSLMRQIHNGGENAGRMPLLLDQETAMAWVNAELPEAHYREILEYEMPAEAMGYHAVYTLGGKKPRPDEKAASEPWEWPALPALTT